MKNYFYVGAYALLTVLGVGCSSDSVTDTAQQTTMEATLSATKRAHEEGSFASPLFDLATTPSGDILVADAGAGIANRFGATLYPLPGVSSIAPVGAGMMWATRGGAGEGLNTSDSGQGLFLVTNGKTQFVANLFKFESDHNPDGNAVDSNPYAVAAINGNWALVVDAGGNDLLRVNRKGDVELVAVFPNEVVSTANAQSLIGCPEPFIPPLAFLCNVPAMSVQPVPTSIAIGPDGYYYVGELKGFPGPTGESNIWRIAPDASGAMCGSSPDCVKAFDGGFTSIVDMTFGDDGMLYVAEMDEQSWFAVEVLHAGVGGNIKRCNPETMQCETIASGIYMLTAITFDKEGNLWATHNALIPGQAEVMQVVY